MKCSGRILYRAQLGMGRMLGHSGDMPRTLPSLSLREVAGKTPCVCVTWQEVGLSTLILGLSRFAILDL